MNKWSLLWKIPLGVAGVLVGLSLLLLIGAAVVVSTLPLPDIEFSRLYLSPLHQSPRELYRAYKGKQDLPLAVEADSLFVGRRGQDTLLYVRTLRLHAALRTSGRDLNGFGELTSVPIAVEQLLIDKAVFHSDSLIAAVGVDAEIGLLDATSPALLIAEGMYPLEGLRLEDTYVGIDLRSSDTTVQDTTPLRLAFDVREGELRNIYFRLTPLGMDIRTDLLATSTLADVGANIYDVKAIHAENTSLTLGELFLPFDTIHGNACVDVGRNLITSSGLHAYSEQFGATADVATTALDLETMRVDVTGKAQFRGSAVDLGGFYDIDDEAYDMNVHIQRVDLSPFVKDLPPLFIGGDVHAEGRGLNPDSPDMRAKAQIHLSDCRYDEIDASGLRLDAELAAKALQATLLIPKLRAHIAGERLKADSLLLTLDTDTTTALELTTNGLRAELKTPMHALRLIDQLSPFLQAVGDSALISSITTLSDLTALDTLRHLIPPFSADIDLTRGSPFQPFIDSTGLDIRDVALSLASDSRRTTLALDAAVAALVDKAELRVNMTEGKTHATLHADSRFTDGVAGAKDIKTDACLHMDLTRNERELNGTGRLSLDKLAVGNMNFGSRALDLRISPSEQYPNAIRADVQMDDLPIDIVDSILHMPEIDLQGAIRAKASADGLPAQLDLSAEVLPLGIAATYKPYEVKLSLGDKPITMEHNYICFDDFPIYAVDSTYLALNGDLDINTMRLDINLTADSLVPARMERTGPLPVYGDLAADIQGSVTGSLDSILADVDVTLLPVTDITYPIDKKNLAQVKPHGTVNVRYDVAQSSLDLGGRINVDDGFIRYSPKAYPIMPFHVDSGSHIAFNGPIGQTMVSVSASQQVKADVRSADENSRRVNFNTGVRVNGIVDSLGLNSIGFFLEAPDDEVITRELETVDPETREGLAATLLATGMYVGESNVSAQDNGYALSSIINSRINAAMANSKMGKVIDVDFSSAKTQHAVGETNDMNIAVSKSFFKDRLKLSIGAAISDNPEVLSAHGLLNNISAEYKLTKQGDVALRVFAQRDCNNIFEGELLKYGLGLRAFKQWNQTTLLTPYLRSLADTISSDSITRTYSLIGDVDIAYRSNNSIGPNLTLTSSVRNLLGKGETLSLKFNGAYYWALRDRHPGDPKKTDTYKLGVTTALIFPYLHWLGDNNPSGDTRYMLGYQYENIAGGYGVHKVSGSFSYFIRTSRFITHSFTPFSLSMVHMKAESSNLYDKASEYPQLIKLMAGDELVPSVAYHFTYDNNSSKRPVNTMFDVGIKEAGNLTNAIYCLFGYKWNEKNKPLGKKTFNQFVKLTTELHNRFNITDDICFATRLFAGANIPFGNSTEAPLSEAFYAGGPNSMRACTPYAYGPGNFYSAKYNQNFFHAGDVKLEANVEFRFPIYWKLYGAAFLDAGNVWTWYNTSDVLNSEDYAAIKEWMQLTTDLKDGIIGNSDLANQIALGTGIGLRLDFEGLVVRLDIGVGIHAPYQTYKRDKNYDIDYTKPINTYFNMPTALDALRLNFGIGYPF